MIFSTYTHTISFSIWLADTDHRKGDCMTTSQKHSPFRLNLEQQKKRAKELLKDIRLSNRFEDASIGSSARQRFNKHHPKFTDNSSQAFETIKLSDAQLVIARELGLPSWAKLKEHIAAMTRSSAEIHRQAFSPDSDDKTLHIRCGTDLKESLPKAGFTGDFLEYSDPYGQGPIIQDQHFIKTRAKFLYQSYSAFVDLKLDNIQSSLEHAEEKLQRAAMDYERVVLWFEHDGYDQLILSKLMAYFSQQPRPKILEMVSINHFPGSERFIGFGQLPPEAIRLLWKQRQTISSAQLIQGGKVWHALGQASPLSLYESTQDKDSHHLSNMNAATYRHLQELPSTLNGLSLTEQLTLELLNNESMTAGQLFSQLTKHRDPLPWLGDIMYWFILSSMAKAREPVFEIADSDLQKSWRDRQLHITQTGAELLSGKTNWRSLNPPERWLGGVKISSQQACWHWDDSRQKPILK